jgi:Rieske 2Fe-2S family protein
MFSRGRNMTYGQTRLRDLIQRRRPNYALEAPFYTDPDILAVDLDIIFGRHWIFVGVEPDVAAAGDCMAVDVGQHAIIVARNDDGSLHGFHNVCRHRGARLLQTAHGNYGNIVCPYHQWTYALNGQLLYAGHMPLDFDTSCHGLRTIHVRTLAGLIFVCLAETPPDGFAAMESSLAPYIAPHDVTNCKVAYAEDIVEHGNWKLTMENNRECYHCSSAHPELTRSIFAEGFGFAPVGAEAEMQTERFHALVAQSHTDWEQRGLPSREIDHLDDRVTGFRTERLPLEDAGESETLDTRVACRRLLGALNDKRLGALSIWTQPNSWHHFMSDHIVCFAVFPLTTETTLLRTKWLVHRDAVEGQDYEVANLTAVWRATNRQDSDLVRKAGAGVRCSGYRPGPYSPDTESLVEKFSNWYVTRLAGGTAP